MDLYIEDCAVHKHRDDVPLHRHHVWPLYADGPDTEDNIVLLCPTAHAEVHIYMREIEYLRISAG
jgi:5-methylcytosine-specific restriction endonuclease McrA